MGPGVYLVDPYGPGPPHQHAPQHHTEWGVVAVGQRQKPS